MVIQIYHPIWIHIVGIHCHQAKSLQATISSFIFNLIIYSLELDSNWNTMQQVRIPTIQILGPLTLELRKRAFKLIFLGYTAGWNVWGEWFLAGTQSNHQNFDPSLLTNKLWLVFMGMKQFFFSKFRKIKMADSRKVHFSKLPILDIFLWKFHGLVLGLVGLIDAKGIDVAQPIWSWGCPT